MNNELNQKLKELEVLIEELKIDIDRRKRYLRADELKLEALKNEKAGIEADLKASAEGL